MIELIIYMNYFTIEKTKSKKTRKARITSMDFL